MIPSLTNILYIGMAGLAIICLLANLFIALMGDYKKIKVTTLFVVLFVFSLVPCLLINVFDVEPYMPRNSIIFLLIVICSGISIIVTINFFVVFIKNVISKNISIKFNIFRILIVIVTISLVFIIFKWSISYSKLINTLMWSDFLFAYQIIFLYFYLILCFSISVSWLLCKFYNKFLGSK